MEQPVFSIITINYNNAMGLRKTMQSVLDQNYSDFEYIVIDGGSTDGSKDVIQEFLNAHSNASKITYWCSEKDGGIYPAMNKGIKIAKGHFICMLNSGDCFCDDVLPIIGKKAIKYLNSILYGAVSVFINNKYEKVMCLNENYLPEYTLPHQGVFIPKYMHEKFGYYDESFKVCADYDFLLTVYQAGVPFQFLDLIVSDYDGSGLSSVNVNLVDYEKKKIWISHGVYISPRKVFLKSFFPRIGLIIKKLIKG
ncbi:MAG: glycosyltransferase [Treponema sp.]|nr:glycosyltransferase [Treponema sp.]